MGAKFDWQGATRAELLDEAMYWAEQADEDCSDYMDPADADWAYVVDFPLSRAIAASHLSIEAAQTFITAELGNPMHDAKRIEGFRSMLRDGPAEPILYVDRGDASFVWDGWHRIAAAAARGDATIVAIVGVKRR